MNTFNTDPRPYGTIIDVPREGTASLLSKVLASPPSDF